MDATVSTAPWWYVAALAGGFTILGGLITLAGGWLSDRRKLNREDRRQWDRDLRDVAVKGLANMQRLAGTSFEGVDTDDGHMLFVKDDQLYNLLIADIQAQSQMLELIASKKTARAFNSLWTAARQLAMFDAMEETKGGKKKLDDAGATEENLIKMCNDMRDLFMYSVRKDIRIQQEERRWWRSYVRSSDED